MKILVTGANGQLGRSLQQASRRADDTWIFTDVDTLDILDADAVERAVKDVSGGVVINCAAYTNVEAAESDEATARLLNADAPAMLAEACRRHDATLVHISTDYVFGGNSAASPRNEADPTAPLGAYGRTKLEGEQRIAASGCKALIIRTAWLYSPYGRNFLLTMLGLMGRGCSPRVVADQIGTPTYAPDLAAAIAAIVNQRAFAAREGIYHFTNAGVASWYDFAHAIARFWFGAEINVEPCATADYPTKVRRPAFSVLDKSKFTAAFGLAPRHWADALAECHEQWPELSQSRQ